MGEGGLGYPVFPLNSLEIPLRRDGVQWKRAVLGGGGGVLPPNTAPCPKIIKRQRLKCMIVEAGVLSTRNLLDVLAAS